MGTDRTPDLMLKLADWFAGPASDDGLSYTSNQKYAPHIHTVGERQLPKMTLMGWQRRDWVIEVRDADKEVNRTGRVYLTDEGRRIVEAVRSASD